MKSIIILIVVIISFIGFSFAGTVSFTLDNGPYNSVPEPRLRYPIYESVTLTSDLPLEFQWWNDLTETSGFILKIYKGYNMYADNLILKKELSSQASTFSVESKMFEDGQIYTWSLVRVSFAGYKSDRSFNSFKVIKK